LEDLLGGTFGITSAHNHCHHLQEIIKVKASFPVFLAGALKKLHASCLTDIRRHARLLQEKLFDLSHGDDTIAIRITLFNDAG